MHYSTIEFINDIDRIAERVIMSGKEYDYIVGVVRGGAIPAVCLSHRLGLPMKCVSWSTFHAGQMRESAWDVAEDVHEGKKILLVDDILDSGRTFKELFEDWGVQKEQVDVAVLIYNTDQGIVPEYYGRRINKAVDPSWVTFWWESEGEEL